MLNIIFIALFGFILSSYIRYKQLNNEKLICILGEDCNKVIGSKYATTLGIPNTYIGMFYYGLVVLVYMLVLFFPYFQFHDFGLILKSITMLAMLFSWRLIVIQIVIIGEWCEWCMVSSILSTIIFLLVK